MKKLVTVALLMAAMASTAQAEGDVKKGEKVFKKCKACHAVGDDAKAKTGPILNNIFGATAGTNEEYASKYSKALKKAGEEGLVWTEETLDEFLKKPKNYIKKIKMAFAGLKKDEQREDIIAYLKQFSPDYQPAGEDDGSMETKTEDSSG